MTASVASSLALLPEREREKILKSLTPKQAEALEYDWEFWGRSDQLLPAGNWVYWLPLAGRGWGKTRTGAETVRRWVVKEKFKYVNLIGATTDDVLGTMIEGESGIMNICPKGERPRLNSNRRRIEWPNGAISKYFSAEEPNRLRGQQHMKLWADELAAWRYPAAWDQAVFGLRLGSKPQAVITTTPRPTKIIRELVADPLTHVTRGSTYDNAGNLAETFIRKVISKYEGTRLGRQELEAEILSDTPGALWTRELIEAAFVKEPPPLRRIVVAVDPPVTSGENADECGIIVAGLMEHGGPCVLADLSSQGESPLGWATRAVSAARLHNADSIVAEVNNGGEMVEAVIRQVDANIRVKSVRASHGKFTRAEPVAALYEQRRAKHCGVFSKLEDQMCLMTPDFDRKVAGYSPDRVDALVWAITELCLADGDGTAIIDFYKRAVAEDAAKQEAALLRAKGATEKGAVALIAPEGVSTAYGMSGRCYNVGKDRRVVVLDEDAGPLIATGFAKESA